jgi:hypothetical protein
LSDILQKDDPILFIGFTLGSRNLKIGRKGKHFTCAGVAQPGQRRR